jgi:hypothetical protein
MLPPWTGADISKFRTEYGVPEPIGLWGVFFVPETEDGECRSGSI